MFNIYSKKKKVIKVIKGVVLTNFKLNCFQPKHNKKITTCFYNNFLLVGEKKRKKINISLFVWLIVNFK